MPGSSFRTARCGAAVLVPTATLAGCSANRPSGPEPAAEQPAPADAAVQDPAATSEDFRCAAAVAGFGQLLRNSEHLADFDHDDVVQLASLARMAKLL